MLDPLLADALEQVGQTLQIVVLRRQVDESLALPVLRIQNLLLPTLANVYTRTRVRVRVRWCVRASVCGSGSTISHIRVLS